MATDDQLQREMQRYLAHFHRAGKRPTMVFSQHAQAAPVWTPFMDMYETSDALIVLLDLAGVEAEKTEVHAEPHMLVIRGMRRERRSPTRRDEQRSYLALEIPYGRFERSVRLPPGLDTAAAQASYRDGLLEISLPKRRARQVPISTEDAAHAP
jgi:HSP20 family protein